MYHVVIHGQEVGAEYHHAVSYPRLHVDREGEGPVVVLAHGFAGSARNFGPQARALRPRFRVVRYDARGHARSEAPDDPSAYTPETFADDLGRVLDPGSAVVGGLSMGAATALRFALASPERVRALVLAAFPAGASASRGIASQATAFADAIERDGLDAAGERFAWGPTSGLDTGAARLVRQGFLEHPPHGLVHTLRGVLSKHPSVEELIPRLDALAMPVLVIVGDRDRGSLEPSRALASALPSAQLIVVPDAGHVVNLEQPAAFNDVLTSFLDVLPV
jgi:pimeloyl-ACP methyl ester carboxylesterase